MVSWAVALLNAYKTLQAENFVSLLMKPAVSTILGKRAV